MSKTINWKKKFKPPNKIFNFTQVTTAKCKHLNHSRIFSLKHLYLNSIRIKIQTEILILKLIKSEQKQKQKNKKTKNKIKNNNNNNDNNNKENLTFLSHGGEDLQWWSGQASMRDADLRLTLFPAIYVWVAYY